MHSQPLDPMAVAKNLKPLTTGHKSSNCSWRVLVVFIIVAPEECGLHPVDFDYKKVIVVDKAIKDGKN
ncbi:putative Agglutinin-2 precursor [Corchorus olitorius]|uniref:Agglutinin-2 n=1 Tax=Corchorus olitorius TaxID=93759 RepID=A0A1R3JVA7_9ROSI|nr:putative Agglutinin-2 precursor [Corchorus olitorius]